jgi:hypothetical protein
LPELEFINKRLLELLNINCIATRLGVLELLWPPQVEASLGSHCDDYEH